MDYNIFSSTGLKLVEDKYNQRAKLDTGTFCNYECYFCYYLNDLDKITPVDIIKKRAKKLRDFGISEVDLSGGESAVHRDWFQILDYCNELGFTHISALTNGSKFANLDFAKKSFQHGLKELLFSVHGYDEKSHDEIVGRKGAYRKILKAISNCKEVGIRIRINCTVTNKNFDFLESHYVDLINQIKPEQLNFLPLNYWEDANKLEVHSYNLLSESIKKAIDKLNPEIEINVRYIPYCFMKGYEKYVVGVYQHIFDRDDWNIMTYEVDQFEVKEVSIKDYFEVAKRKREYTYSKKKECFDCKYFFICDGVEKKVVSEQELYPVRGEKIEDVNFYRRGHYPICDYNRENGNE
ncbi:radical SAM protein [Halobacteriovorax sp. GB3]|uniref:radical SAM protein n=1 Tax=Halobacteriovorax sp. GB3 TaxID=2719615 RepID=UPI00235E5FFE|nr:radical SAM protein [Halobacteriovorax sp. GB3]MDD0854371.1 radical SAM protein [Halobacteriovorax sp. GB3]